MPNSFQIQGFGANVDERGLITAEVPMYCETINEALTISGGNPFGLPEFSRSISQVETGGYEVRIRYEGTQGKKGEEEASTYEFDTSFQEESYANHPDWPTLAEKYGGTIVNGQVEWAEQIPRGNISRKGLSQAKQSEQVANPLLGTKTYRVFMVVFRRSYMTRNFPLRQFEAVMTIREKLPKGLPTPKSRNWLIMPPKISKRGRDWEVTEEWMLSAPGKKWNSETYKSLAGGFGGDNYV